MNLTLKICKHEATTTHIVDDTYLDNVLGLRGDDSLKFMATPQGLQEMDGIVLNNS